MQPLIIYPSNEIETVLPKNGKDFKLEEVNIIVEGPIEIVNLPKQYNCDIKKKKVDWIMIVNEEGKLEKLEINHIASIMYNADPMNWYDAIVGTVLICPKYMVK
jgi:hypothetical protein